MKKAALLLLPNLLGNSKHHELFLPSSVDKAVSTLDGLISESDKGGKQFMSHFKVKLPTALYNKNVPADHIDFLLEPMKEGQRWGYVSDAGLPCIADPGAKLVMRARELGIAVQTFVGPCSITHALMLSGLPGQHFSFHGYLNDRTDLKALEKNRTHIFIEAPHHNEKALTRFIESLHPKTLLCTAANLTLPTQSVITLPVKTWKNYPKPNLHKNPCIFLFNQLDGN